MTPTEMHIDALMEKIEELKAENARYIERIEELTSELSKLKVQADRHREALEIVAEGEAHPLRYYQLRDLAREALKGDKESE